MYELDYFANNVGAAILYKESRGGFSIERRIQKQPGIYKCRVYNCPDMDGAMRRFGVMKRTLAAMQTRREKRK